MKKVTYEYQITIDHGNDIWHWDLQDTQKVIKDIAGHKGDDGFYVELVKITKASDDIFDFGVNKVYFDIFPKTEILDGLPKYVREEIDKIVIALMVGVKSMNKEQDKNYIEARTNCKECNAIIFKEHLLHTEKSCPSLACGSYWIANYYSRGATYCHETSVPDGEAICYKCQPNLKNDIDLSQLQLIQGVK